MKLRDERDHGRERGGKRGAIVWKSASYEVFTDFSSLSRVVWIGSGAGLSSSCGRSKGGSDEGIDAGFAAVAVGGCRGDLRHGEWLVRKNVGVIKAIFPFRFGLSFRFFVSNNLFSLSFGDTPAQITSFESCSGDENQPFFSVYISTEMFPKHEEPVSPAPV